MHHLIFEGAELSGKSWIMSQVYDRLEPKYNKNKVVLDGCHWFNCDVGVFGTEHGRPIIESYLDIFTELQNKNILTEKFHLADIVNNRLHFGRDIDYGPAENRLKNLGFKIVLVTFPEDEEVLRKRIQDRLNLYPHYERILQNPAWYIEQQREYLKEMEKTRLEHLIIQTSTLPDTALIKNIMDWIGE